MNLFFFLLLIFHDFVGDIKKNIFPQIALLAKSTGYKTEYLCNVIKKCYMIKITDLNGKQ